MTGVMMGGQYLESAFFGELCPVADLRRRRRQRGRIVRRVVRRTGQPDEQANQKRLLLFGMR